MRQGLTLVASVGGGVNGCESGMGRYARPGSLPDPIPRDVPVIELPTFVGAPGSSSGLGSRTLRQSSRH